MSFIGPNQTFEIIIDGFFGSGDIFELEITKSQFEQHCQPIFDRAMIPVKKALQAADIAKDEIDEIIMVGGSSRITRMQEMLTEYFGKPLNKTLNPDQAIATGAAINAGMMRAQRFVQGQDREDQEQNNILPQLQDIVPMSMGIRVCGMNPRDRREDLISVVIPRGTPIPHTGRIVKKTARKDQTEFPVIVLQGENEFADYCKAVQQLTIEGIPQGEAGA